MLKIRLTRLGDKRTPFYRIVVADSRKARDAEYVDLIGTYNPLVEKDGLKIDADKANKWLANGAQPTDTVKALLKKSGIEKAKKPAKKEASSAAAKPAAKTAAKAAPAKKPAAKTTATKTAAKKETK